MLTYQFSSTQPAELKGIRFPFLMEWHAERGAHHIQRGLGGQVLEKDKSARIRPEELFHIYLVPDHTGAVAGTIELEVDMPARGSQPGWESLATALSANSRGFGLALTQAMFRLPGYAWSLETVAAELKTTRRCVQQKLFREGYSFCAALHRCRRLHSFINKDSLQTRAIEGRFSNPILRLPRCWSSRHTQSSELVM